jgi:CheY-like chemotaxis protein
VTWSASSGQRDTPELDETIIDQQGMRVLVADHDRWARLRVSDTLSEAGFAVEQASNGMAALRSASADPPQIVLIAHDLPEITTVEVIHTLRHDPRMQRTALVQVRATAYGGIGLDVDGRLDLPCKPIDLLATLLNALEARGALPHAAARRVRAEYTSAPKRARDGLRPPRVAPTLAPA